VKATHKELMDAAQAERKWWKPLVKLNREQRVLDQRDAEEKQRASAGAGAGGGPNGGGGVGDRAPGAGDARANDGARAGAGGVGRLSDGSFVDYSEDGFETY
jgi:hypothetical protein